MIINLSDEIVIVSNFLWFTHYILFDQQSFIGCKLVGISESCTKVFGVFTQVLHKSRLITKERCNLNQLQKQSFDAYFVIVRFLVLIVRGVGCVDEVSILIQQTPIISEDNFFEVQGIKYIKLFCLQFFFCKQGFFERRIVVLSLLQDKL